MTGAYISFPFCAQKCTYCNFASGVFPRSLRRPYLDALCAEIKKARFPSPPETLYFGGGTPSLLAAEELEAIFAVLPRRKWREATIEAAPGTVTSEKARLWRRLGIDRVSLGVQSFSEPVARAAGRRHTPRTIAEEVRVLRSSGIGRINIDLIAGLAHQTAATWRESLDWIARLEVRHVSVYMLEVDDESRLGEEIRRGGSRYGAASTPSEDEVADFYETAVGRLAALGIERYEISNFAAPGEESAHNLKYWSLRPYLGFGADAHSFDGRRRWANAASPSEYVARAARGESLSVSSETIDERRKLEDLLLTGLRRRKGLRLAARRLARLRGEIERLSRQGRLEMTADGRLRLTDRGVMFSNDVFRDLMGA